MDRGAPLPTRVFLVDGRELLRRGAAALLAVQGDLEVVGEAARAVDVLPRVRATRPGIVLLGGLQPEGFEWPEELSAEAEPAAEVCRALRDEPEPPVCLLLVAALDEATLLAAERSGAAGCLPEDVPGGDLVVALQRLAAGHPLHDHADSLPPVPPEPPDPLAGLSATDREIVSLIGEGLTNRQIGTRLGLSERTIKNHVSRVLAVLAMERRTQVAALASTLRLTVGSAG